jgi:hypothetical protein
MPVIRRGVVLNVAVDISFDKIPNYKRISDKIGEVNSANHENSR